MKRSIILLTVLSVLFSCSNEKEEKLRTIFSGKIENPLSNVVRVYNGDLQFVDTLDSEGRFSMAIEIDKPYYFRLKNGEYTVFYIRPGDSLHIELNSEQFDESIVYTGDGAELSQFNASMVLHEDTAVNYRELMSLDEPEFLKAIDTLEKNYLDLLANAELKDEQYVNSEKEIFFLLKGKYLLSYENAHARYADLDSFTVSEVFYRTLEGVDLNDSENMNLLEFSDFLNAYLNNDVDRAYAQLENPAEADYYRLYMEAIEQKISNPDIKVKLHYAQLSSYPFTYVDDETRTKWISYYEALSPDSSKLAHIKERKREMDLLRSGNDAPGFTYETINGDSVSLSDLKGSFVYIDVWATWCRPCMVELPYLEKLQEEFKDSNVKFVSVSIDNTPEPWRKMVTTKEMKGIQLYAIGAWGSEIVRDYLIGGIPRFILIGPDGRIIDASAERPSGGIGDELKLLLDNI